MVGRYFGLALFRTGIISDWHYFGLALLRFLWYHCRYKIVLNQPAALVDCVAINEGFIQYCAVLYQFVIIIHAIPLELHGPILISLFAIVLLFASQTYIGPVLVSVNPYRNLDLYSTQLCNEYRAVEFFKLPPHV